MILLVPTNKEFCIILTYVPSPSINIGWCNIFEEKNILTNCLIFFMHLYNMCTIHILNNCLLLTTHVYCNSNQTFSTKITTKQMDVRCSIKTAFNPLEKKKNPIFPSSLQYVFTYKNHLKKWEGKFCPNMGSPTMNTW